MTNQPANQPTNQPVEQPDEIKQRNLAQDQTRRSMDWATQEKRWNFQPYYGRQINTPGPQQPQFWNSPQRVARYHLAANMIQPGVPQPDWLDRKGLDTAYEYLRRKNEGQPWYLWKPLDDNDPGNDLLKSLPMPPPQSMLSAEREQFYPAELQNKTDPSDYMPVSYQDAQASFSPDVLGAFPRQGDNVLVPSSYLKSYSPGAQQQPVSQQQAPIENGGMPQEQYNALPGWQKAVIAASPWLNTVVGGLGGAVTGAMLGGVPGALVGGLGGAALAKGAESNEILAQIMNVMNVPAQYLEQGAGVLGQVANSIADPEQYGNVHEVLNNLGAAFEAGKMAYNVSFAETKDANGNWKVTANQLGQADPVTWYVPNGQMAAAWAMTQGRRRIANNENPDLVIQEIQSKFGFGSDVKDMVGQMLLDPLNMLGDIQNAAGSGLAKLAGNDVLADSFKIRSQIATIPENFKRGLAGEKLLDAGNMFNNDTLDALRLYGNRLRQMPIEDAARFGALSKWFAGLDAAGNIKELQPGQKPGGLDYMRGLTPQARAHEVIGFAVDGFQTVLRDERDPMMAFGKLAKIANMPLKDAIAGLEDAQLPKWFQSAEAQPVVSAMKGIMPQATELAGRWQNTREQATVLQRVADMMGMDVNRLKSDLHSGTAQQAADMYRAFMQSLEKRAAGDAVSGLQPDAQAAKLLKILQEDQSFFRLDGQKLKEYAATFLGKDAAPFSADEFRGMLMHLLTDGTEQWSVKYFGVKPPKWYVRTGNLVKRAQGLALLGLNPTFMINNALNNMVTLGWDGLLSMSTARSGRQFLRDINVNPIRLRQGANAAELVDVKLASKEMGGYQIGEHVREASRAGDLIQAMDDFARKGDKFAKFAEWSQKFEGLSSEMAMTTAMRRYFDNYWTEGRGITRMPADVEQTLDAFSPNLARKVKRAIERGKSKEQIERMIFQDLGRPSIKDVLTVDEKDLLAHFPGLVDDLDRDLGNATTDEDIRTAYTKARGRVQKEMSDQIQRNMRDISERAKVKVEIEGGAGMLDVYDQHIQERADFWLQHFEKMDAAAEEADRFTGYERQAVWNKWLSEADRDWRAYENVEGAKWLGILEGLGTGKEDPAYLDALMNMNHMHDTWGNFFSERQRVMNEFFAQAEGADKKTRSELWAAANQELNRQYANAILAEDELQGLLDENFSQRYKGQFPDNPQAYDEALRWRRAVADVRRRMAATQMLWREGGVMPDEVMQAWGNILPPDLVTRIQNMTAMVPPYVMGKQQKSALTKKFMSEIYAPYVREMVEASSRTSPGKGIPIEEAAQVIQAAPEMLSVNSIGAAAPEMAAPAVEINPTERLAWLKAEIDRYKQVLQDTPEDGDWGNRNLRQNAQEHIDAFQQELTDLQRKGTPQPAAATTIPADARAQQPPAAPPEMAGFDAQPTPANTTKPVDARSPQAEQPAIAPVDTATAGGVVQQPEIRGATAAQQVIENQKKVMNIAFEYGLRLSRDPGVDGAYKNEKFVRNVLQSAGEDISTVTEQRAREIFEARKSMLATERARANRAGVYRVAAEFGIGSTTKAGQDHIINILIKYGGVDDIDQVTEEMARAIFADRAKIKGAEDAAAMDAIRRKKIEFIAETIKRNQEQLSLAAPKRFTRDAFFREVEEQVGSERAQGIAEIVDALAEHWAEENGKSVEDWYDTFILTRGGTEGGGGLGQSSIEDMIQRRDGLLSMKPVEVSTGDLATITDVRDLKKAIWPIYDEFRKSPVTIISDGREVRFSRKGFGEVSQHGANRLDLLALSDMPSIVRDAIYLDTEPNVGHDRNIKGWHYYASRANLDGQETFIGLVFYEDGRGTLFYDSSVTLKSVIDEVSAGDGPITNTGVARGDHKNRLLQWLKNIKTLEEGNSLTQGNKGLTRWMDNGKAVVHAFESADTSTFVHEIAHVWLPMMGEKDIRTVESWLKAEYGLDLPQGWQNGHERFVQAKEYFARGFERYLAEGRAPTPILRKTFENFKRWMLRIYKKITGSQIDIKLNDEITGLFDRWIGKKGSDQAIELPGRTQPEPVMPADTTITVDAGAQPEMAIPPAATPNMVSVPGEPVAPLAFARVNHNIEKNGIEIKFDTKPSQETISKLKSQGYRWSSREKLWYKKYSDAAYYDAANIYGKPSAARRATVEANPSRWPTFEEWKARTGVGDYARGDYSLMIRKAVMDSELGFDEAAELVGKDVAGMGMFDRFANWSEANIQLTQKQYVDAARPWSEYAANLSTRKPFTDADWIQAHQDMVTSSYETNPKKVSQEVLKDYPELYLSQVDDTPPASVWDGTKPQQTLFEAPEGQMSLFGEQDAGFGLIQEQAKAETFKPETQQQGLFGLGDYTARPEMQPKTAPDAEDMGPLFNQPPEAPTALQEIMISHLFKHNGKEYRLLSVEGGKVNALGTSIPAVRKGQRPRLDQLIMPVPDFEDATGFVIPERLRHLDQDNVRLALREMLMKEMEDYPNILREDLVYMLDARDLPGTGKLGLHGLTKYIGADEVKKVIDEVWDLHHKPQAPIETPVTIQPDGIQTAINTLADIFNGKGNQDIAFSTPRAFEEWMQQTMGLDMNEEANLNIAYDALEGAFNMVARQIRADLDQRNAPLAERLQAMADLEGRLLRARRTVSKMALQQFSTPLSISEAAGFAADVRPGDVILEPTAGTANLVDRFKLRDDVTIRVNEIDEGRRRVLSAIGYDPTGNNVQSADWLLDGNMKRRGPLANVVISNPPWGSYSTGKYGKAVNTPVEMNDWSQRFTYLIMQRMSEGGRFVGVMPQNWLYTVDRSTREIKVKRSAFMRWLEQTYDVKAVIESPPDAYKQRGTNVGSLLVVIDKNKPSGSGILEAWGENAPKSWDEYAEFVQQLGKDGTHGRNDAAIRTGQQPVRAAVDDEINAKRPATGPDATGLVDPNARAGKPEPDTANIGRPAVQPGLGDTPHTAASIGDLFGSRGAVLPNGRSTVRPDGTIVTEPTTRPVVGRPDTPGGIGVSRPGGDVRGADGERISGRAVPGGTDVSQPENPEWNNLPDLVGGDAAGVRPGVSEPVQAERGTERLSAGIESGDAGTAGGPAGNTGGVGRADDDRYRLRWKSEVGAVERAGAFTGYVGRTEKHLEGEPLHHHPSLVVETKALAGVAYPELEQQYKPSPSVMEAYRRGDLSVEGQLDPVWAAVQQNDKHGMGILIADDVGMGKSRTAAAFALDRIERGKKKILVVTKNRDNIANLMNGEFPLIFGEGKARFMELAGETMPKVKKGEEPIPFYNEPTVYFMPSTQFKDFTKQVEELNVDAVIIDEAHVFKNVDETKIGGAWTTLHKSWTSKNVSFMYLTATPATDLIEMKFLYGLKLWTTDGFGDWIGVIKGDITPEQAKKAQAASAAFNEYVASLDAAVKQTFGETGSIRVNGKDEIGYQISPNLVYADGSKANTGTLYAVSGNYAVKVFSGDSAKTALLGKYLKDQGDLTRLSEWSRKMEVESAIDKLREEYVQPQMDQETRNALGIKDASDALDILDKKGRKKFGKGRSAFETTLPPEHTEQIMREMKLGGSYLSRDISRIGVDFDAKKIELSPEQVAQQNRRIELYRDIVSAYYQYGKMNKEKKMDFGVFGALQADAKRALFDLRLQQALPEVQAALQRGEKVVISIVSVSETDPAENGNLRAAIEKINHDMVEKLGDGVYSDPEEIPEAMIAKAMLQEKAEELGKLQSPIDYLRAQFGDRVGFITGEQTSKERQRASKRFQKGELDICVISGAGKTGINLHDIDGQRRVHLMVIDYDWSATEFKQELGRVDRTGQKTSPVVTMFHTGNAGELKFISTITNRMKGLGATSKGGAESTGTSSLNEQFELGSSYDKQALNDTWKTLSRDEKALFIDKWFMEGDSFKASLPETAEAIKKFTLGLQTIPMGEANRIVDIFMNKRAALLAEIQGDLAAKAAMQRGEVLRKTEIGNNLSLSEVRDETGHRFGIASGVLTPYMNKLAGVMGSSEMQYVNGTWSPKQWREWIGFQDTMSEDRIAGLVVPPGKIEQVARTFGTSVKAARTPETALQDMRAGDKIPVRGIDGAEWNLYLGNSGFRQGKIVIDGAKISQRGPLMNNGALLDARGNFFYVPENNLQDFLRRFILRESDGLAQAGQPGETYAFGPYGQKYNFKYRVVSLDDLVQSHTDTFDVNPKYPAELQPRNRDRSAYREQVQQIAQNLDERALIDTHMVDTGTPITGSDKVVENGNGRVMAMRRARMDYPERWAEYQKLLRERLADYGFTEGDLNGVKDPVLIRERVDDVDRVKFANEAQASQSMQLTIDELASTDAQYVDDAALATMTVGEQESIEGALKSAANRELVNAFLNKVPAGEKSRFLSPDGTLSMDGLTRMRNAIFVHVYPGDAGKRLANAFLVSQSEAVSNIRAALFDTLGIMSQSEALIKKGYRDADLSITDDLARAVDMYARLKQQGASIDDYLKQMALFGEELNPLQKKLLEYIHTNNKSRRKLRELLSIYADDVVNNQTDPSQMALFGGARASKGEILDIAAEQVTGKDAGFVEIAPVEQAAPVENISPAGPTETALPAAGATPPPSEPIVPGSLEKYLQTNADPNAMQQQMIAEINAQGPNGLFRITNARYTPRKGDSPDMDYEANRVKVEAYRELAAQHGYTFYNQAESEKNNDVVFATWSADMQNRDKFMGGSDTLNIGIDQGQRKQEAKDVIKSPEFASIKERAAAMKKKSTEALNAPVGTAEQYHEPPIEEAALEGWMKDVGPLLDRAEKATLEDGSHRQGVMNLGKELDAETKKGLKRYLGQVYADLSDTKLGMIRYGENRRDAALLNYTRRTGFDNLLGTVMPYEFWYTRSMVNWALRAISKPAILANWARMRQLNEKMQEQEESYPTRLKKKFGLRMPFLPDWMGDKVYMDPLKQLYPFEQMARPWETMSDQQNLENKKAESNLAQMVKDEEITEAEMQAALKAKAGPLWERALAQARNETDREIDNPLDFAFMMSAPSLPLSIAYNYATGNKDRISQLPITRMIQANTAALGIGGERGINIEAGIRKAAGLPEVDRFEDYRVDRMLANMAADGVISSDDAQRAMIDRSGPAFQQAQQKVSQMGVWQYWGAPLGVDMFPEGEQEQRRLKGEYDKAREKWANGDSKALTAFFDEHPEYEARSASFREPEERLRRYLISEVWDRYGKMPSVWKDQAQKQLGNTFSDAFLDKETRSYDSISTTTLASWAQMLGANNPEAAPDAPQMSLDLAPAQVAQAVQTYKDELNRYFPNYGQVLQNLYSMPDEQRQQMEKQYPQIQRYYDFKNRYLANHPEIIPWVTSDQSELYGLPVDVQTHVYNYRAQRSELYPGIDATQDQYYSLENTNQKKAFRKDHPELTEYWAWRRQMAASFPTAAPYILSDETLQNAILGDQAPVLSSQDIAQFSPQLLRALAANVYTGEELRAGSWNELDKIWQSMGEPYGSLEKWVEKAVEPTISQQWPVN